MALYFHIALVPGAGSGAVSVVLGSVLMVIKTKPLPSPRSTHISIALALPLVHRITGCPALICTFSIGFQVVGSTTWGVPMIHKSCPMAVVNFLRVFKGVLAGRLCRCRRWAGKMKWSWCFVSEWCVLCFKGLLKWLMGVGRVQTENLQLS